MFATHIVLKFEALIRSKLISFIERLEMIDNLIMKTSCNNYALVNMSYRNNGKPYCIVNCNLH